MTTSNRATLAPPAPAERPGPDTLYDCVDTLEALAFIRDRCLTPPPRPAPVAAPAPLASAR